MPDNERLLKIGDLIQLDTKFQLGPRDTTGFQCLESRALPDILLKDKFFIATNITGFGDKTYEDPNIITIQIVEAVEADGNGNRLQHDTALSIIFTQEAQFAPETPDNISFSVNAFYNDAITILKSTLPDIGFGGGIVSIENR